MVVQAAADAFRMRPASHHVGSAQSHEFGTGIGQPARRAGLGRRQVSRQCERSNRGSAETKKPERLACNHCGMVQRPIGMRQGSDCSQPAFPDVYAQSGKWFRRASKWFRRGGWTKQSSKNPVISVRRDRPNLNARPSQIASPVRLFNLSLVENCCLRRNQYEPKRRRVRLTPTRPVCNLSMQSCVVLCRTSNKGWQSWAMATSMLAMKG